MCVGSETTFMFAAAVNKGVRNRMHDLILQNLADAGLCYPKSKTRSLHTAGKFSSSKLTSFKLF
jgi:hypothetical protein